VNEVLNDIAMRKGIDLTFHVAREKPKNVSGAAVVPVGELLMKQAFEEDEKKLNNDEDANNKKMCIGVETQTSVTSALDAPTAPQFDLPIVIALRQWGLDVTTNQRKLTLNRCLSSPV
jgi:hypothetical protein